MKEILDDTEAYYVLAYEPTERKQDGSFRKIEVKLPKTSGVRVRTRSGYFAPADPKLVIAPADGLVTMITRTSAPPELAGEGGLSGEFTRVSIFMSVFDVHVNRTPIAGRVKRLAYVPGKFLNADLDKASEDNERQHFLVERDDGVMIGFTQIAGLVARRIISFVREGDTVNAGERIGLIRFGSRVDVYLPAGTGSQVLLGQRTIAGETVLAQLGVDPGLGGISQ